ncbi:MAG TPA: DUF4153 domain-containing protein [Burkholderiales bacterium]|nr:DUF4153 domain-containing protein [Burkholderiales bacterium]
MAAIPILVIAVVQGWLLYGLHYSLEHKTWPATETSWLFAFYAVALFVPVALEIFAARLRERLTWALAAAIAAFAGALGAYTGWVADAPNSDRFSFPVLFALYGALFVSWFIALPFAQAWARRGTWRVSYPDLFEFSWQNALLLAEAALFTGVFWMLLFLWGALFKVVDIAFFWELFTKPAFFYPISSIAFGYAIYLIESHEKIVVTLRRHLLGVFGWLLPLVALIAVLFLLALPFTGLQPLWKTGHASTLMLWLQFLFIHFLNSAYEDGQSEPRYPAWLKQVVRFAVFALPVYAALCAYSLGLRVAQHGWTVARVWAAIATFIAALYGIGYAAAALRRSPWMGRMAPVNVGMAAVVAGVLLLATSPILDPKRMAAASQVERLRTSRVSADKFDYDYLRFDLGRYGSNALAELSKDSNKEIARLASASLEKTRKYGRPSVPPELLASRIELFPAGAALDPAFIKYLEDAVTAQQWEHPSCLSQTNQTPCLMVALDLNGDGQAEILSFNTHPQAVYGKVDGQWGKIGNLVSKGARPERIGASIRQSSIKVEPTAWRDVSVGEVRFTLQRTP